MTTVINRNAILLDSGLNCIYIISGDEATMIPDTDQKTGVEFGDLRSLVVDDLGNMIVVDSASEQLQVFDIGGSLIGTVKVKQGESLSLIVNMLNTRSTITRFTRHIPPASVWTGRGGSCTSATLGRTTFTNTGCNAGNAVNCQISC